MADNPKISAVIITGNEEKKIERCLKSIDWVDEIIVVDSFSTDRTVEICKRYTDKIYQHTWPHSSSEQRKFADRYANNDWVLALDADEVVTIGLRDEIIKVFTSEPHADLFMIPRQEYVAGKWIKAGGWYPQYKTLLYRKSMGEWIGPIHLKVITRGAIVNLNHPILHDGYASFRVFMDKFNYYSTIESESDYAVHKKRFNLFRALFKPIERFFGRFIKHQGYRDGVHGFFMAAVISVNYFLRELKLYEYSYREKNPNSWDDEYRKTAVGAGPNTSPAGKADVPG
ncbi:MAG: glycosyltransferase family 2 protein [Methanothrix sp.]|nr:glycosyltransferase family 2 protein [Methanothrix sp.]